MLPQQRKYQRGGQRHNVAMSTAWSRVEKDGRRLKYVSDNVDVSMKPRSNQLKGKKPSGIVGTCAGGNIQVVKTKLVSVFATKFSPDLDSETLANYLRGKFQRDVTCQKMGTSQNRYSSSKVTAECDKVGDMYEPQLWPDGVFVRRFYEAWKTKLVLVQEIQK